MRQSTRVFPLYLLLLIGGIPQESRRPNVDLYGDPLPEGAIARLGTTRFRRDQLRQFTLSPDGRLLAARVLLPDEPSSSIDVFDTMTGEVARYLSREGSRFVGCPGFSPDGRKLASVTQGGGIVLWDLATGDSREIEVMGVAEATGAVFTPDLRRVVVSEEKRTLTLDTATGKQIAELPPDDYVGDYRFSADGTILATEDDPLAIQILETDTGKELHRVEVPGSPDGPELYEQVDSITLSPDGSRIAAVLVVQRPGQGYYTMRMVVMEVATGVIVWSWDYHDDREITYLGDVAFSPDGKRLLGAGNGICCWDAGSGKEFFRVFPSRYWYHVYFSTDGETFLTVGARFFVLRDAGTGDRLAGPEAIENHLSNIASVGDGKTIAAGERRGTVSLWCSRTGRMIRKLEGDPQDTPRAAIWYVWSSPGGGAIVGTNRWGSWTRVWNTAGGKHILQCPGRPLSVRLRSPRKAEVRDGEPDSIASFAFSADDGQLAVGRVDGSVRVRSLADTEKVTEVPGHDGPVGALAFSEGGKRLLSWGWDAILRETDLASGKEVRTLTTDPGPRPMLAEFSQDGRVLACGDGAGKLHVWEVESGRKVLEGRPFQSRFSILRLSEDGRRVLVRGVTALEKYSEEDPNVHYRVWDVELGREVFWHSGIEGGGAWPLTLEEEEWPLIGTPDEAALSPDGRTIASDGVYDRTGLWEVATGGLIRVLPEEPDRWYEFAFCRDGSKLTTLSPYGALVWDLRAAQPIGAMPPDLQHLWACLADGNCGRAYQAMSVLGWAPTIAIPFIQEHLSPVPSLPREELLALIDDLDNPDFTRREVAQEKILALEEGAHCVLREVLEGSPSPEAELRIRAILGAIPYPIRVFPSERLRSLRAVQVLERIGTAEAREILRDVAGGAPGALRTREARAALKRLESR